MAAWAIGGLVEASDSGRAAAAGYSPVDDAISRLAAEGADARTLMTLGFVAFGVGVPCFGLALRRAVAGPAWVAAVVTGLATLGVAATPLDRSPAVDDLHAAAATVGYLSLVALPLLAARSFAALARPGPASPTAGVAQVGSPRSSSGRARADADPSSADPSSVGRAAGGSAVRWTRWSVAAGLLAAGFLLLTLVDPVSGLFQRAGLLAGDLWIATTAAAILSGHLPARTARD